MELEPHRDLRLLEALAEGPGVTQRSLAARLGIAVGLTNLYIKRLARKGYIKCVNVKRNRLHYLITPRGLAEKARLTYEFAEHSVRLYSQTRRHLRTMLVPQIAAGHRRFAIYGTDEWAELAFVSLKEFGLEPVAFLGPAGQDRTGPSRNFLGVPLVAPSDWARVDCDRIIVASSQHGAPFMRELAARGLTAERLCALFTDA